MNFFLYIKKYLDRGSIRYLLVGSISAFVDISIFTIIFWLFNLQIIYSSMISFVFAVNVNYLLANKIVFKSKIRFKQHQEYLMVLLVSLTGLFINILSIYIFVYFGFYVLISKIISAIPTFIWNYLIRKLFIFKNS